MVTPRRDLGAARAAGQEWAHRRHADRLRDCLAALRAERDGRRCLPNGMLHDLREGLFCGRAGADARLRLNLGRHERQLFRELLQPGTTGDSLFWEEDGCYTALLDALDLNEFWE